jgi:hypothetical protein
VLAWLLNCWKCNHRLAQFKIDPDDFASMYLAIKPTLLKGGKEYECPNCGQTATYLQADVSYLPESWRAKL